MGLLPATRIGKNGYRNYDQTALVRLQRILMLRDLGLGLPAIGDVIAGQRDDSDALAAHLAWLRDERSRLDKQIASVEATVETLKGGEQLMAEEMFGGFDHTQYREEVVDRWGAKAYADSDRWWRSKSATDKSQRMSQQKQLAAEWMAAAAAGGSPSGDEAQALAERHAEWLGGIPGTPGSETGRPTKAYFIGLGEMYVADERFAAKYGGLEGAGFVRDAMAVYAEKNL